MEKRIITFKANNQNLQKFRGIVNYASDTVSYIEAHFELDANWESFDSVKAVWSKDASKYATVLDAEGKCIVPSELLQNKGAVYVNLVGSVADGQELIERLTTFPIKALSVTAKAIIDGDETQPITPSQFEQFVEIVKDDADRAETAKDDARGYAEDAETSASNASASEANASASEDNAKISELNAEAYKNQAEISAQSAKEDADRAEQAAADAGFMFFHIDGNGYLIMEHTENVDNIDFELINGHLILEVA